MVALFSLYSKYFYAGSYLLVRAGIGILLLMVPLDAWHLYTTLWWIPAIALGACVAGFLGAIPGMAMMLLNLSDTVTIGSLLWSLLGLYLGLGIYHVRQIFLNGSDIDSNVLLLCLLGGTTSLVCGIHWGWGLVNWCNLLFQCGIGGILYYRPQLLDSVVQRLSLIGQIPHAETDLKNQ